MTTTRPTVLAMAILAAAMGCDSEIDDQSADGGGAGGAPGGQNGLAGSGGTGGAAQGGGGAGGAGACDCPAYDGDGSMPYTVTLSLDCLCQIVGCPASPDAMLASVAGNCPYMYPEVRTGCGVKVISYGSLGGGAAYFDAQTGALLAMMKYDDIPWGKCQAHVYQTAYQYDCPTAQVCSLCADASVAPCP